MPASELPVNFWYSIIGWITCIIATERVAEIIVHSELFGAFREKFSTFWVHKNHPVFAKLVTCGWCTSVWIAGMIAFLYSESAPLPSHSDHWPLRAIVLCGLSNYWHTIFELIRRGRTISIDVQVRYPTDAPTSDTVIIDTETE